MRRHKARPPAFAPVQAIEVMALARQQSMGVQIDRPGGAIDILDGNGSLIRRALSPSSAKAWLLRRAATEQGPK